MPATRSFVVDDTQKGVFLLDREALVSDEVLRNEMSNVFAKCWIYVGHGSEVKKPGDFHTRRVAGRPVIFVRDQTGQVRCHFNTCRHRGAIVCNDCGRNPGSLTASNQDGGDAVHDFAAALNSPTPTANSGGA